MPIKLPFGTGNICCVVSRTFQDCPDLIVRCLSPGQEVLYFRYRGQTVFGPLFQHAVQILKGICILSDALPAGLENDVVAQIIVVGPAAVHGQMLRSWFAALITQLLIHFLEPGGIAFLGIHMHFDFLWGGNILFVHILQDLVQIAKVGGLHLGGFLAGQQNGSQTEPPAAPFFIQLQLRLGGRTVNSQVFQNRYRILEAGIVGLNVFLCLLQCIDTVPGPGFRYLVQIIDPDFLSHTGYVKLYHHQDDFHRQVQYFDPVIDPQVLLRSQQTVAEYLLHVLIEVLVFVHCLFGTQALIVQDILDIVKFNAKLSVLVLAVGQDSLSLPVLKGIFYSPVVDFQGT